MYAILAFDRHSGVVINLEYVSVSQELPAFKKMIKGFAFVPNTWHVGLAFTF